jgi:hypothetical protein
VFQKHIIEDKSCNKYMVTKKMVSMPIWGLFKTNKAEPSSSPSAAVERLKMRINRTLRGGIQQL